jgi:hypothetical protein
MPAENFALSSLTLLMNGGAANRHSSRERGLAALTGACDIIDRHEIV